MIERGALGLVLALVAILIGASILRPPAEGTSAPKAVWRITETGPDLAIDWDTVAGRLSRTGIRSLATAYRDLGYDLEGLRSGSGRVPRLFLASLPRDMGALRENRARKAVFFLSVLPLVLQTNDEIRLERRRLWRLRSEKALGLKASAQDRLWLAMMSGRYRTKRGDVDALLNRVDIIPPSLALAQAAEESGWGTSRFVREGNAIFGQWTTAKGRGLAPLLRDTGLTHKVRSFDSLLDSVRSYARNLNTHPSYRNLRNKREMLRRKGAPLDGSVLAGQLKNYSQRGEDYVATLRTIIEGNNLRRLDDARLIDAASVDEPQI